MPRSRTAALALTALLLLTLLPPAAARPVDLRGRIAASSVSAQGAEVAGPLVALWQEPTATGPAADPGFTLRAAALRVEVDRADLTVASPVDRVRFEPRSEPPQAFADAVVRGTANAPGYRWVLLATDPTDPPTVRLAGPCAQARPPTHDSLERSPRVNPQRGDALRDLTRALAWSCLDGATLEVAGNLTLALWAWNATVASAAGRADLPSGDGPSTLPDPSGHLRSQAEVYLFATGATLTLPAPSGGGALLYTGAGTTLASGSLVLQRATGHLDAAGQGLDLRGGALGVEGHASLALWGSGSGKPLAATLAGQADRVAVDGAPVALATTLRLPAVPLPWLWAAAGLAVLLLVAEARRARLARDASWGNAPLLAPPLSWRERRGTGFWMLARRAATAGRVRRSQVRCAQALRWFPDSTDARLLEAALLVKRGDFAAALGALDAVHGMVVGGPERFEVAAMASSSAMLAARPDDALAWLRRAAEADPLAFTQEVKKPLYDPLEGDAWFRGARSSFARAYLAGDGPDPAFS